MSTVSLPGCSTQLALEFKNSAWGPVALSPRPMWLTPLVLRCLWGCSVWWLSHTLSPRWLPLPALGQQQGAPPGDRAITGHCHCTAPSPLHTLPTAEQLGGYL